jgi:nitroreductase
MDAFEAIRRRRSVREFSGKTLSKGDIEALVDSGRLAPTARKEEPWEFVVVSERDRLARLAGLTDHGRFIAEAACAIVVVCRDTKYYLEDGCAATENILIAASAMGLGACWVAGDKKHYSANVLEFVGAPAAMKLISILAIGYPKTATSPIEKRPIESVIHWEKY